MNTGPISLERKQGIARDGSIFRRTRASMTELRRRIAEDIAASLLYRLHYVDAVWLYGSVARGTDNRESDIDILCLVNAGSFPCNDYGVPIGTSDLVRELEAEARRRGFDANIEVRNSSVFYRRLKEAGVFYENVDRDKIVLYSSL